MFVPDHNSSLDGARGVGALGSTAILMAPSGLASFADDAYQPARTKLERIWMLRTEPTVLVDVFDGGIWVYASRGHK